MFDLLGETDKRDQASLTWPSFFDRKSFNSWPQVLGLREDLKKMNFKPQVFLELGRYSFEKPGVVDLDKALSLGGGLGGGELAMALSQNHRYLRMS